MKIYISGALDAAKDLDEARQKYDSFALHLRMLGFDSYAPHHVTDPVRQSDIAPSVVFATDRAALLRSDVIVAFLDEPSFGVGAEVAIAIQEGKLVIGLVRNGKRVSRFLGGLIEESLGAIVNYENLKSAALSTQQFLALGRSSMIGISVKVR